MWVTTLPLVLREFQEFKFILVNLFITKEGTIKQSPAIREILPLSYGALEHEAPLLLFLFNIRYLLLYI
jgi:hypothetical protein